MTALKSALDIGVSVVGGTGLRHVYDPQPFCYRHTHKAKYLKVLQVTCL